MSCYEQKSERHIFSLRQQLNIHICITVQYFGHRIWRTDSLEKTLILEKLKVGGDGDDRGWDDWKASPTWWTWVWASSWSWWWTGKPGVLQSMGSQRVGNNWVTELKTKPNRSVRIIGYVHYAITYGTCIKIYHVLENEIQLNNLQKFDLL